MNFNDSDLLICGRCQFQFRNLKDFMNHKSNNCINFQNSNTHLIDNNSYYDLNNVSYYPNYNSAQCSDNINLNYSNENIIQAPNKPEYYDNFNYEFYPITNTEIIHIEPNYSENYQVNRQDSFINTLPTNNSNNNPSLLNNVDLDNCQINYSCKYQNGELCYDYDKKQTTNTTDVNQSTKHWTEPDNKTVDVSNKSDEKKSVKKCTKTFSCQICKKQFLRHSNLQQHLRIHNGEKPFQCPICGRKFAQKSNAKKHIKSHKIWANSNDSNVVLLSQGDIQLDNNKRMIVRPSKSLANIVEKKNFTVLTDKNNSQNSNLIANNSIETTKNNQKPPDNLVVLINNLYQCKLCLQKFPTYHQIRSHCTQHKDQQKFVCIFADCQQTYSQLGMLLDHLDQHKAHQPLQYKCGVCSQQFDTLFDLNYHSNSQHNIATTTAPPAATTATTTTIQGHNTSKPIKKSQPMKSSQCPICPVNITSRHQLINHIKQHNSLILYKCRLCNKSCRSLASLRQHRKIHKSKQPSLNKSRLSLVIKNNSQSDQYVPSDAETLSIIEVINNRNPINNNRKSHLRVPLSENPCDADRDGCLDDGHQDGALICFNCGKFYYRRLPFESHVLLCKHKELENERRQRLRESKRMKFQEQELPVTSESIDNAAVNNTLSRSSRRTKFQKTWKEKPVRSKRKQPKQSSEPQQSLLNYRYQYHHSNNNNINGSLPLVNSVCCAQRDHQSVISNNDSVARQQVVNIDNTTTHSNNNHSDYYYCVNTSSIIPNQKLPSIDVLNSRSALHTSNSNNDIINHLHHNNNNNSNHLIIDKIPQVESFSFLKSLEFNN